MRKCDLVLLEKAKDNIRYALLVLIIQDGWCHNILCSCCGIRKAGLSTCFIIKIGERRGIALEKYIELFSERDLKEDLVEYMV